MGLQRPRLVQRPCRRAGEKTGQALNATETDLSAFKAAGGKLIQYHGWNDSAIPPTHSIDYYESVGAKIGGLDKIQPFFRLFMAPGMEHCGGGPGANAIGGVFGLPPPSRDPAHDVVSALAHWVEDGAAPGEITATLYKEGDPSQGRRLATRMARLSRNVALRWAAPSRVGRSRGESGRAHLTAADQYARREHQSAP